jgi:hypothetical protein
MTIHIPRGIFVAEKIKSMGVEAGVLVSWRFNVWDARKTVKTPKLTGPGDENAKMTQI